jgi:hypothetical protein
MFRRPIWILAATLFAIGCQTSSVNIPPFVGATHFYVGSDNTPGVVLQYNLPLAAGEASNFSVAANTVVSVALDPSGNMMVGDLAANLKYFTAGFTAGSTPSVTFANGAATNNGQNVFTPTGDLWAATVSNRVNLFTKPFTNASTPATFVTNAGMVSAIGLAMDGAQNLYVGNAGSGTALTCASGAGSCSNIMVFAPPYTGAPVISTNVVSTAYRKMAVSSTQLFIANVGGGGIGNVDVYTLPITAASAPAFSITTGINTPEGIALDSAGKLYVGNLSNATITVYTPPFSAASAPTASLQVSAGAFAIFGIAVGP